MRGPGNRALAPIGWITSSLPWAFSMPDPIPCPKCGRLYVWDGTRCCRKDCRYGSKKKPRKLRAKIAGVYPVEADEPVHLVEISIEGGAVDGFDFGEVTQEMADMPRMNWQAPYDERVISETDTRARVVFFLSLPRLHQAPVNASRRAGSSTAEGDAGTAERNSVRGAVKCEIAGN